SSGAARERLTEDPAAALRLFEVALAGDPASPYRWCDLGDALVVTGDLDRARFSFARALELGPNLPPVLLRVANFDLGVEERQKALASAARILRVTSECD